MHNKSHNITSGWLHEKNFPPTGTSVSATRLYIRIHARPSPGFLPSYGWCRELLLEPPTRGNVIYCMEKNTFPNQLFNLALRSCKLAFHLSTVLSLCMTRGRGQVASLLVTRNRTLTFLWMLWKPSTMIFLHIFYVKQDYDTYLLPAFPTSVSQSAFIPREIVFRKAEWYSSFRIETRAFIFNMKSTNEMSLALFI